jgi:site-specific recombinase XerD
MFEFSVLRGYHTSNPVAKTAKAKVVRGAPDIFSPEQMKSLLECASDALLPHLAIGAFSGLRTTEIEWSGLRKLSH